MQTPVEIDFHGLKADERLRACVMKNISVLEQRFGRITAGRVVIRAPSERHRTGGVCEITIRLSLPQGREVDIGRSEKAEKADPRLADPVVALNAAFKRARRRLQDHARRMRGDVKTHDGPPIATVKRFDEAGGFGFLETRDGREIYFHRNSILDGGARQMEPGTRVTFCEEMGNKGPQASTVKVLGKHSMR
ncbi:MAG TPA: HPF/RaiA family ribosome-associated protein [Xanthobacteraceae bacterium]|jgi:cold shock CspA family protein/ribosome-associated translation inhibitor RaiA|nr:HPF/RaiA family ribosome-associated protein [Xanthobacteraceae bacterium]